MKFKLGREIFFLSSGQQRTYHDFKTPSLCPMMTLSQHCAIQRKNVHFTIIFTSSLPITNISIMAGDRSRKIHLNVQAQNKAQRNTVPKMKKGMKEPIVLSSSINRALVDLGEM